MEVSNEAQKKAETAPSPAAASGKAKSASASGAMGKAKKPPAGGKKRKATIDPAVDDTLQRKRSISRKSSQRNREKQRGFLETLQIQQKTLNGKNRALKVDNDKLKEHIAAIKRYGVSGIPPVQLGEAKRALITSVGGATASATGGGTSVASTASVAHSDTAAANFPARSNASMASMFHPLASSMSMNPNQMRLGGVDMERYLLERQSTAGAELRALMANRQHWDPAQELALLQYSQQQQQQLPSHLHLQLLQQQLNQPLLSPFARQSYMHGPNLLQLQHLAASQTPPLGLGSVGLREDDATRRLLLQSVLHGGGGGGSPAAAGHTPSEGSGARSTAAGASSTPLSPTSATAKDPPGNRAATTN